MIITDGDALGNTTKNIANARSIHCKLISSILKETKFLFRVTSQVNAIQHPTIAICYLFM
jgi:hypothetical protein